MGRSRRLAGRLFVLSRPSGGGKTTVARATIAALPRLVRSVSVTTRAPRPGERHGVDYRFVSPASFEQLRREGQLLEWARVHEAYYGTPAGPVERAVRRGQDVLLCIDIQGAREIRRRTGSNAVLIFLTPPSIADLRRRLIKRRTDSEEAIRHRLTVARRELAASRWYDYTVMNQRLREAVEQLKAIILAERARVRPAQRSRRRER